METSEKKSELVEFRLDLPYKMHPGDRDQFKKTCQVTAFLLRHAVNKKWTQEMPRTDSRIWAQIQDDLLDDPDSLLLSKNDFEWIKEIVSNCDYPASMSSWRWTLLRSLEKSSEHE